MEKILFEKKMCSKCGKKRKKKKTESINMEFCMVFSFVYNLHFYLIQLRLLDEDLARNVKGSFIIDID